MTDQTPSTEAGRNAFIDLQRDPPPQSRQYWDATIFAIEEQARVEGRQQAVREIEQYIRLMPTWDRRTVPGGLHIHRNTLLEWVAGLNASESPPLGRWPKGATFTETLNRIPRRGDASESGQPPEASDDRK